LHANQPGLNKTFGFVQVHALLARVCSASAQLLLSFAEQEQEQEQAEHALRLVSEASKQLLSMLA